MTYSSCAFHETQFASETHGGFHWILTSSCRPEPPRVSLDLVCSMLMMFRFFSAVSASARVSQLGVHSTKHCFPRFLDPRALRRRRNFSICQGLSPLSMCVGIGAGGFRAWSFSAIAWMPSEISRESQTMTLIGGFEAITNGPLRLNEITSSLVKIERGLWLAAKGVTSAPSALSIVLPLDMAVCSLAVILEISQIAGLATPYLEVDPVVRGTRRDCLRLGNSESDETSGKQSVASCRTDCLLY